MKKFEKVIGIIAVFAIILKFIPISGSSILTTLTLSILTLFYYVFSFAFFNDIPLKGIFKKSSYKSSKRIVGAIGVGFALSSIILGITFKLQFWPGAIMHFKVGLVTLGIILLIAIIYYSRTKAEYYIRIFKRIAIYGSFGLILYLTPATTLADIYYRNNPEYAELFKQVLADPNNEQLREQLEQMRVKTHGGTITRE